jgi:hypothetical protein
MENDLETGDQLAAQIPLWVKVVYTLFVCVLVPVYLKDYGPTNFLYFCDVALLITVPALWLESPLLASMPAVGIVAPQILWIVDFLLTALGLPGLGMTGYMFDEKYSLFIRFLSFFHFWLPFLLVWLVYQLGYDRRALFAWTILAWGLMLVCYFFMPGPPAPEWNPNLPVNINYVYGLSEKGPQTWMPPLAYLGLMLVVLPAGLFWPTHLVLAKLFGSR